MEENPELEVAVMAANGKEAVEAVSKHDVDVVIMDVEMPVMNGIEATAAIRQRDAHLPIVMFSSITAEGADATMKALAAGANDYLPKPSRVGQVSDAMQVLRSELIPKIIGWGRRYQRQSGSSEVARHRRLTAGKPKPGLKANTQADILAIGISTGGPDALAKVLPDLPASMAVPVVIVQHMPPVFTGLLAKRLDLICPLEVREAADGDVIDDGGVWIAPGGSHMIVCREKAQTVLRLQDGPPVQSCKPSVDVMFKSVAECYGPSALAAVLTGMGQDGLEGVEAIKKSGGQAVIQDEDTCVVWGMPAAVDAAGLADAEYPLEKLAEAFVENTRKARRTARQPVNQFA
jgi:two-component system chemotaxis response regulator CheB